MIWQYISSNFYSYLTVIIFICCIGLIDTIRKIAVLRDDIEFSNIFLMKFDELIKSRCQDNDIYGWILENSIHMQEILGSNGVMNYKEAGANYYINSYQIITNLIPDIVRQAHSEYCSLFTESLNTKIRTIFEVVIRQIGAVKDLRKLYTSRLKNPFYLFSDGWFIVISIPLKILHSLGIISFGIYSAIRKSIIYKLILLVVFSLGIYADILSVKQGHPSFFDDAWQAVKGIFTNP